MVLLLFVAGALLFGAWLAPSQDPPPAAGIPFPTRDLDKRLPNGKSQRDEIVKADYKKNLEEASEMAKLAEEVKADLEKDDKYIVSLKTLKKTEDIEKLAKSIRARMKRY